MDILEKYKAGELMLDEFLAARYLLEAGDVRTDIFTNKCVEVAVPEVNNQPSKGDCERKVIKSAQLDKLIKEQEAQKQEVKQPTPHPHKALIERYISDTDKWAVISKGTGRWARPLSIYWAESFEYKVVLKEYADLACKYFNGECEVEVRHVKFESWHDSSSLLCEISFAVEDTKYREKPKPQPKDGEWWMCEWSDYEVVLLLRKGRWQGTANAKPDCTVSTASVKPLYKMVKADEN